MLPARNRKDLEEVPAEAKQKLEFVFLEDVDDAVRMAIEPAAENAPPISTAKASGGRPKVGTTRRGGRP